MSKSGHGWSRGVVVRKGGTSSQLSSRSSSVAQSVPSLSSTIYGGGVKDPSGRVKEFVADDDQCPVCRSDRYLNPRLRLLVSSCYHKMCESCIDRLFTLGPAPCPICNKTLRKLAFTPQTFEDLTVEKEVAVRRRMAKEFIKKRHDFPDLHSYNNYLEEVEDITFNLINEIDVAATEARIATLRADNAALTELNIQRDEQAAAAIREEEERERHEKEDRAREVRSAEQKEREEMERKNADIINKLEQTTGNAALVVAKSRAAANKRAAAQRPTTLQPSSSARLLRSRAQASAVVPDIPHIPFTDSTNDYSDKYNLKVEYRDPISELVRLDRDGIMRAGGYRVEDAWDRAIRSAIAGLEIIPLEQLTEPSGHLQSVTPLQISVKQ